MQKVSIEYSIVSRGTEKYNNCGYMAISKIYDSNNTPHQHVMCRCELIPLVDGWKPSEKWDNENKQRISYKTYKDWLGEQDIN